MSTSEPTPVTPESLRSWPLPEPDGGKEARGRVLVVGGSIETPGSTALAAEAALRAGAGKVTLATVESATGHLGIAIPESRVCQLPESRSGMIEVTSADRIVELSRECDVLLVGTGLTDPDHAARLFAAVLPRVGVPVVLDAAGSAYLTADRDGLSHLGGRAVLNVNPVELAHVAGVDESEIREDPVACAAAVAEKSDCAVICGGRHKWVVSPDGGAWRVHGDTPGLGISGSGDVQAGLVSGIWARGAERDQAAVWGAWLHASAGARLEADFGAMGYLARELAALVPGIVSEVS
jgi:ADP-dependent NAD(P)H-hydrate dehydratase